MFLLLGIVGGSRKKCATGGVSVVISIQCFDSNGIVTGRHPMCLTLPVILRDYQTSGGPSQKDN